MPDIRKVNLPCRHLSIGALPNSYLASLSYEEQLLCIGKKTDEIINFINDILEEKIIDYINIRFNDIMLNTMYDAETETLILYLDNKGGN